MALGSTHPLTQMSTRGISGGALAYPGIFFGGVQQIQLRTEDKEDGDLGVVAP